MSTPRTLEIVEALSVLVGVADAVMSSGASCLERWSEHCPERMVGRDRWANARLRLGVSIGLVGT